MCLLPAAGDGLAGAGSSAGPIALFEVLASEKWGHSSPGRMSSSPMLFLRVTEQKIVPSAITISNSSRHLFFAGAEPIDHVWATLDVAEREQRSVAHT